MDRTSLAAGTVAEEGSICDGGGTRAEDLGGLQKWMVGGVLRKFRVAGSEERM